MKKSTILLLVVVYILSFFIIGLLGHSIRSYDPTILPESVELVDVDNRMAVYKDYREFNYYFVCRSYVEGTKIRLKANVKPDDTSYKDVRFFKDDSTTDFNLLTYETNPDEVEQNFVIVTLNIKPSDTQGGVLSTRFHVETKNPGVKISLLVGISFTEDA